MTNQKTEKTNGRGYQPLNKGYTPEHRGYIPASSSGPGKLPKPPVGGTGEANPDREQPKK
jgi:hypothetical protein